MNPSAPTAAIATALIAGLVALLRKFLPRKQAPKPEYITRAEFHAGIESTRDRIGASYLALAEKIEQQHNQVLTTLDSPGRHREGHQPHVANLQASAPFCRLLHPSATKIPKPMNPDPKYFIKAQIKWIEDDSLFKLMEKYWELRIIWLSHYRRWSL